MDLNLFLDNYLKKRKENDNAGDTGYILNGLRQLYEVTGEEKYRQIILQYADENFMSNICNGSSEEEKLQKINAGKILFLLYEMTGMEKYKNLLETLAKEHLNCRNTKGLYEVLPFQMEYETKFHNKAGYNDIVQQFIAMEKKESPEWYAMALIDALEHMSIEIFEHYKSLQEIFKKTIKSIQVNPDAKLQNACIGYAIVKACNMGILNPEKYSETGLRLIDGVIDDPLLWDDDMSAGILMMACAQSVQFQNNN